MIANDDYTKARAKRCDVLELRMAKLALMLEGIAPQVACTCDPYEQGGMTWCPAVVIRNAAKLARKSAPPFDPPALDVPPPDVSPPNHASSEEGSM